MEKNDKLRVDWNKRENDVMFHYPLGLQTKTDAHYLHSSVFTDEFIEEIKKRGYDIKTLKFEIQPDFNRRPEKFQTIAKKFANT